MHRAQPATEVMRYGIPTLEFKGMLLGYAAFSGHCSLFPAGSGVVEKFAKELKPYATNKGPMGFPADKPLPDALLTKIVTARVAENREWD